MNGRNTLRKFISTIIMSARGAGKKVIWKFITGIIIMPKGIRRVPALLPWEYPMKDVVSLCHACHEKEQGVKGYSEHEKLSEY